LKAFTQQFNFSLAHNVLSVCSSGVMGALFTPERIVQGARFVSQLDTFPLFCGYVLMILLAGQWKRFTKPLGLRWVGAYLCL